MVDVTEFKRVVVDLKTHKRLLQLKLDYDKYKTLNAVIKGLLDGNKFK